MVMRTLKLAGLDVLVYLHTPPDPTPAEWAASMKVLVELKQKNGGDISRILSLVVSDGGAPDTKQRAMLLQEILEGRPQKIALITNTLGNPIKRGIVTAISWVNPAFRAVPPERWAEALRHIGLEGKIDALLEELRLMQAALPPVKTLALLEAEVRRAQGAR
jgi:hypothetical protein